MYNTLILIIKISGIYMLKVKFLWLTWLRIYDKPLIAWIYLFKFLIKIINNK